MLPSYSVEKGKNSTLESIAVLDSKGQRARLAWMEFLSLCKSKTCGIYPVLRGQTSKASHRVPSKGELPRDLLLCFSISQPSKPVCLLVCLLPQEFKLYKGGTFSALYHLCLKHSWHILGSHILVERTLKVPCATPALHLFQHTFCFISYTFCITSGEFRSFQR